MQYEASIDYFQVIKDKDGKSLSIGVAMQPAGSTSYLTANSDRSLSLGALSHGYDTVLSVATDYRGYTYFLVEIWQKKPFSDEYVKSVGALTLDDSGLLSMANGITDDDKKTQQLWIATCTGDVQYDAVSKDHLSSAGFTIENVYTRGTYLTTANNSITTGGQATKWTLSMQGMKPERLLLNDIVLFTVDMGRQFIPSLGQTGSQSGVNWTTTPALPDFLTIDASIGTISQKEDKSPPEFPKQDLTITVTNIYGSASAGFSIVVKSI